jgi:hypothetical protein
MLFPVAKIIDSPCAISGKRSLLEPGCLQAHDLIVDLGFGGLLFLCPTLPLTACVYPPSPVPASRAVFVPHSVEEATIFHIT